MNGELISVEYNDNIYFYIKDILGNIIKIIDKNNRDIVLYKYNSWGVVTRTICVTSSDASYLLAQYNPFVFKSYYYDSETRLYYLNSRFYSPELCRFITVDDHSYLDPESLGSISLYCYCGNNPIMMIDPSGHAPKWLKITIDIGLYLLTSVIATVALIGVTVYSSIKNDDIGKGFADGITKSFEVFCSLNNDINEFYYNYISDGTSDLTNSSYTTEGYISRWDRLDYIKSLDSTSGTFGENEKYYFAEYNVHMYGWFAFGWALDNKNSIFYELADSSKEVNFGDNNVIVDAVIKVVAYLGI